MPEHETAEPPVLAPGEKTAVVTEVTTRHCPLYKVLIHNDDVTPMDFVIGVLIEVFKKEFLEAGKIMFLAHTQQVALVTILPLEQAELRIEQAHSLARTQKFPLTFTCEPE